MMNDIDVFIGSQIRNRRHILGMSQADLANKIGVSFQQIQKYEKGKNKIMASRLFELSKIMNTSINYFYGDHSQNTYLKTNTTSLHEEQVAFSYEDQHQKDLLNNNKDTLQLIKIFNKIQNEDIKKKLLNFLKAVTD